MGVHLVNQQVRGMSAVNQQVTCYCGPNFESCWFRPVRWCQHQWKNLTSPIEKDRSILRESIKRILLAIPLALATLVACLAAIPGFLRCGVTITSSNTSSNSGIKNIMGSNHIATRRVDLSTAVLRAVELHTIGNVVITYSEHGQYVEMTGDDNLLDYLTPRVNGQGLILGVQEGVSINTKNPISYHLHIPHMALNRLTVSGSGSVQVDRLETEKLDCRISGQATVTINNGHVAQQRVQISGQGTYNNSSDFRAENSHVSISGQGSARVQAAQSLNVTISGMGRCLYSGIPQHIQQHISGIGYVAHV
jgi:hypothetical protein